MNLIEFRKPQHLSPLKSLKLVFFILHAKGGTYLTRIKWTLQFLPLENIRKKFRAQHGRSWVIGRSPPPQCQTHWLGHRLEVLKIMEHQSIQVGQMCSLFAEPVEGFCPNLWWVYVAKTELHPSRELHVEAWPSHTPNIYAIFAHWMGDSWGFLSAGFLPLISPKVKETLNYIIFFFFSLPYAKQL